MTPPSGSRSKARSASEVSDNVGRIATKVGFIAVQIVERCPASPDIKGLSFGKLDTAGSDIESVSAMCQERFGDGLR